ncbi:MAG: hypothetical protein PHD72_00790 [Patescibacteria group bacterium]|nr:hypothetical protein [Patescibacteria group bacterium]
MTPSIVYWYNLMLSEDSIEKRNETVELVFKSLKNERPDLCSIILERSCMYQCNHCIFQPEKSSSRISHKNSLKEIICNIASQLERGAAIIHEGRVLKDWHISILKSIKKMRPDIKIGIIDNGTLLTLENELKTNRFKFDWIDISIDGIESVHNRQRNSELSFAIALNGLQNAKKLLTPEKGKLTSLFTITKINFRGIYDAANFLFKNRLIDEFHVTPISAVRREIAGLALSKSNYKIVWLQIKKIWQKYQNKKESKIFIKIYQSTDLLRIAEAVGAKKFLKSFTDTKSVRIDRGSISFVLDGVRMTYIPMSTCPSETFVIDVDGVYRLPYCLKYTLSELRKKVSKNNMDISSYSVAKLSDTSNFKNIFAVGVDQWQRNFGMNLLKEEQTVFKKIRNAARLG